MIVVWCIYNLVLSLGFWFYWPWAALRGKRPASWWQRMGNIPDADVARIAGRPVLWIHAVSVGESMAMRSFLRVLRARYPGWCIVLTTVTSTGQQVAKTLLRSDDALAYFPLDVPWAMHRFIERVQPKLFLAVETEIWPNCFRALHAHGIPVIAVNGRVSQQSFRGYRALRWFFQPLLKHVDLFLMQTQGDADRIQAIGAPESHVHVMGNLKWDQGEATSVPTALQRLAQLLGLGQGGQVLLAGSTHPGEEKMFITAFAHVARDVEQLHCVIAPRHVERTDEVCTVIRKAGLQPVRYSQLLDQGQQDVQRITQQQVVVVDTIGQLRHLYSLATVAFVGGSLVPHGGQNVLEPAYAGKPIVTGPYVSNFQDIVNTLRRAGGLRMVQDAAALAPCLRLLLASDQARQTMGEHARTAIASNRGAMERTLTAIHPALSHWEHPTMPCTVWRQGPRWFHAMQDIMQDRVFSPNGKMVQALCQMAAWCYGGVIRLWDVLYTIRLLRIHRVTVPVISIGNVTAGGTGKSACVMWLARALQQRGRRVAIISRGHRRPRYGARGAIAIDTTVDLGDEPTMFRRELPDVPVYVGRDRVQTARRAVREHADVLVLDDGLQHRRLARSCDIATVDAVDAWGNGRLLPRGPLREHPTALKRAQMIFFTKTNLVSRVRHELTSYIRDINPTVEIIAARHDVLGLYDVTSQSLIAIEVLADQRVVAISSIGAPQSFEQLLFHAGVTVRIAARFPDHHPYSERELRRVMQQCLQAHITTIVTTDKDWMRLESLVHRMGITGLRWYVLKIRFVVENSDAVVDRLMCLSGC